MGQNRGVMTRGWYAGPPGRGHAGPAWHRRLEAKQATVADDVGLRIRIQPFSLEVGMRLTLRFPCTAVFALSVLTGFACAPAGAPVDAGVREDGGAGARDAGAGFSDGGDAFPDAGAPDASVDAGVAPLDAGGGPDADGGVAPEDGGSACIVDLPCEDIAVSQTVQLDVGNAPALRIGSEVLPLGSAKRVDVEAALGGAGVSVGANVFRAYYCAYGIALYYVDDTSPSGVLQGDASANDILTRVVTLSGSTAATSNGISVGAARSQTLTQLTSANSFELSNGYYDVSAGEGLAVVSNADGGVVSLTLFQPQNQVRWMLDIDVAAAKLREGTDNVGKGSSFQQASSFLGDAYEQEGLSEVNSFLDVQVRSYAAFGIRLAGLCSQAFNQPCDNSNEIDTLVVAPPFLGATLEGLGLGATESEVEAAYGTGTVSSDDPNLMVYTQTGGETLGVLYVQDSSCMRYAAAFVLAYLDSAQ